jgi:hypothetical protein
MTVIKQDDLIQSVADALQFISYTTPLTSSRRCTKPTCAKNRQRPVIRWHKS